MPGLTVNGKKQARAGGQPGDAFDRLQEWPGTMSIVVLLSLLENPIPSHTLGHKVHRLCVQCLLST